jgi:hypothetical protein
MSEANDVERLVIPFEVGTITSMRKITRLEIEYKLTERNKVYDMLDETFGFDYKVARSGPKTIDFPFASNEIGLMIVEV